MSAASPNLPKAIDIARRAAHTSGDLGLDLAFKPGAEDTQEVYFDLPATDNERALASATVRVESFFADDQDHAMNATEIGHYDPAIPRWNFYPELVDPTDHEELGKYFDSLYQQSSWIERSLVFKHSPPHVLYRDALTVLARTQTSDYWHKLR